MANSVQSITDTLAEILHQELSKERTKIEDAEKFIDPPKEELAPRALNIEGLIVAIIEKVKSLDSSTDNSDYYGGYVSALTTIEEILEKARKKAVELDEEIQIREKILNLRQSRPIPKKEYKFIWEEMDYKRYPSLDPKQYDNPQDVTERLRKSQTINPLPYLMDP